MKKPPLEIQWGFHFIIKSNYRKKLSSIEEYITYSADL